MHDKRMGTTGFFADKPNLAGGLVLLRPFKAGDIDVMGAILADPEVLTLTRSVHTTTEAYGRTARPRLGHAPLVRDESGAARPP